MVKKLTLGLIHFFVAAVLCLGSTLPKPYILDLTGSCSPGSLSVEYFITGAFGGYSGFVKTDSRFAMYEIPTVRDGLPAKSLKIIVRGARCRTQLYDIPNVEQGGRVIRVRPRRSRQIEFRGIIRSAESLRKNDRILTVEYWAHWKCDYLGIADCLIGPTRIETVDVDGDGKFKVSLPDLANDPVLQGFANRGSFQFFIRDKKTGNILYNLTMSDGRKDLSVATAYAQENEFAAEPYP